MNVPVPSRTVSAAAVHPLAATAMNAGEPALGRDGLQQILTLAAATSPRGSFSRTLPVVPSGRIQWLSGWSARPSYRPARCGETHA